MFKLYPYKAGSESVAKLKEYLDAKVIKLKNSRYRYKTTDTIINWGNSRRPSWMSIDVPVLNKPEDVAIASNKVLTFQKLEGSGVPTVPFTTDKSIAEQWDKVFVRHSLVGHSGEGIEVLENEDNSEYNIAIERIAQELTELGHDYLAGQVMDNSSRGEFSLPHAPLYTKGINNNGEYRVHVFNGEVILYQKKSRRVEDGGVDAPEEDESNVRNLSSGWVYRTGNLNRLERIETLAKDAIHALGLDFGAVDIIKDDKGDVFVLEVNSAPGISNTDTAEAYINAFRSLE